MTVGQTAGSFVLKFRIEPVMLGFLTGTKSEVNSQFYNSEKDGNFAVRN